MAKVFKSIFFYSLFVSLFLWTVLYWWYKSESPLAAFFCYMLQLQATVKCLDVESCLTKFFILCSVYLCFAEVLTMICKLKSPYWHHDMLLHDNMPWLRAIGNFCKNLYMNMQDSERAQNLDQTNKHIHTCFCLPILIHL